MLRLKNVSRCSYFHMPASACQSVSDKYTISGIRYYYEKFSLKYIDAHIDYQLVIDRN